MAMKQTLVIGVGTMLLTHLLVLSSGAQQSASKADQQPYSITLTAKVHSTGHSIYGGQYLNHHANAEISLSLRYRQVGAFLTKSTDIVDLNSAINHTTMGIYKNLRLSESLTVTPYVGMFLRQSHSFADGTSDAWTCVVVRYKLHSFVTIENTALIGNLIRNHSKISLANRLNATISIGKVKLDAYAWYCHGRSSTAHFVSTSVAITSPDWVISPSISVRLQVSMLQQVAREKPEGAMRRGGLISLIVPVNLSNNNQKKGSREN